MDTRLAKWLSWMDVIYREAQRIVLAKHTFWAVQRMIKDNRSIQKPSHYYQYLGDTYVAYALMAIRRQVKNDRQSISLNRLLTELSDHPSCLSRKYYTSLYGDVQSMSHGDFDAFCDAPGDPHVSRVKVAGDQQSFERVAASCEAFADRRLAHWDKRPPKTLVRFHDIDVAIDTLDALCVKYWRLFHAQAILGDTLMPNFINDWQAIFDYPWRLLRCRATTKRGGQCKRKCLPGMEFCSLHLK